MLKLLKSFQYCLISAFSYYQGCLTNIKYVWINLTFMVSFDINKHWCCKKIESLFSKLSILDTCFTFINRLMKTTYSYRNRNVWLFGVDICIKDRPVFGGEKMKKRRESFYNDEFGAAHIIMYCTMVIHQWNRQVAIMNFRIFWSTVIEETDPIVI